MTCDRFIGYIGHGTLMCTSPLQFAERQARGCSSRNEGKPWRTAAELTEQQFGR
jgi:hypothetical protein